MRHTEYFFVQILYNVIGEKIGCNYFIPVLTNLMEMTIIVHTVSLPLAFVGMC